jgi:predicted nucleic acid-binding protein
VKYLVDTDWLINSYRGAQLATETIRELSPDGLAVSIITVGELYEGAMTSSNPDGELAVFDHLLEPFATLPLDNACMQYFARVRSTLRRQGQLIPDLDLLIASTALRHDLILVTANLRHFARIPNLHLHQLR